MVGLAGEAFVLRMSNGEMAKAAMRAAAPSFPPAVACNVHLVLQAVKVGTSPRPRLSKDAWSAVPGLNPRRVGEGPAICPRMMCGSAGVSCCGAVGVWERGFFGR